jgi:thermitase
MISRFRTGAALKMKVKMKLKTKLYGVLSTFILLSSVLVFNNCQPNQNFQSLNQSSNLEPVTPITNPEPFAQTKLQISEKSHASMMSEKSLSYVALVDNSCLKSIQPQSHHLTHLISAKARMNAALDKMQAHVFVPPEGMTYEELSQSIENDPCVIGVGPNYIYHASFVANDPMLASQKHLTSLHASEAWQTFFSLVKGITKDVRVAVLDSGVDANHPDLKEQVSQAYDFTVSPMKMGGFDDTSEGHGTHVSGLIGAKYNNAVGVSGVMGKHLQILSLKVLDRTGSGDSATIANAMSFATSLGAEVINMSFGGPSDSTSDPIFLKAMTDAINAGSFIAMAAGNDAKELGVSGYQVSPARFAKDLNGALAVASVDTASGGLSWFSSYSKTFVEIAAPGNENANGSGAGLGLLSTLPTSLGSFQGYGRLEGTSMATPIVSGAACLIIGILKSNGVASNPALVKSILLRTAIKNPSLLNIVKDGNSLDLEKLAIYLQSQYMLDENGGFRDAL